jgi:hypothetical protein
MRNIMRGRYQFSNTGLTRLVIDLFSFFLKTFYPTFLIIWTSTGKIYLFLSRVSSLRNDLRSHLIIQCPFFYP